MAPGDLLALQQVVGNQAVTRLIQRKLKVGSANSPGEQEAERVAEQVMNSDSGPRSVPSPQSSLQRASTEDNERRNNRPNAPIRVRIQSNSADVPAEAIQRALSDTDKYLLKSDLTNLYEYAKLNNGIDLIIKFKR